MNAMLKLNIINSLLPVSGSVPYRTERMMKFPGMDLNIDSFLITLLM